MGASSMVRFAIFGGLGFLFLYLGIDKIIHPGAWHGWLPSDFDGLLGYPMHTWFVIAAAVEIGIGIGCIVPHLFIQRVASFLAAAFFLSMLVGTEWTVESVRTVTLLCMSVAAWYSTAP